MSDSIRQRLAEIFRDVFDVDDVELAPHTVADDVDGWDSLGHIRLIVTIEQSFGIRFSAGEVSEMKNVGDLVSVISAKTS